MSCWGGEIYNPLGLFQMLPGVPVRLRCRNNTDKLERMQVFPTPALALGEESKDTCPLYYWRMANLKPGSDYLDVEIVGVATCIT